MRFTSITRKAFDKVNHMHLITKLKTKFKIAGQPLFWISQFLTQRVQYVKINGCTSDKDWVLSSIVQGSCLGPCLFYLVIFDLQTFKTIDYSTEKEHTEDDNIRTYKFADDSKVTNLTRPSKQNEDQTALQNRLNVVYE